MTSDEIDGARANIIVRWHQAAREHTAGYLSRAVTGWAAVMESQREKAIQAGYPIHTRYQPDHGWCSTFGHMAVLLEVFAKMRVLGLTKTNFVVLADPERIVNQTYFDLIKPHLTVLPRNAVADIRLTEDYLSVVEYEGQWVWYHDVWAEVQQRWQTEGRAPLIALSEEQVVAGCQKLGLGPNDWFVVLHTRSLNDHNSLRDSDISYYTERLNLIEAEGGRVIRIPTGDSELDIFLLAQARFGIFGNSGPAWIAGSFGTPALLVNYNPVGIPYPYKGAIVLPKKLKDKGTNKLFEPDEYVEPYNHVGPADVLLAYGAVPVPCTLDEVTDGIKRMLASTTERK